MKPAAGFRSSRCPSGHDGGLSLRAVFFLLDLLTVPPHLGLSQNNFRILRTLLAPREGKHHVERDEYGSYSGRYPWEFQVS